MRKYEIWVHHFGEYAHLHDQRVYPEFRYWFKKNAEKQAESMNRFHVGLRSIGNHEPCMEFFVVNRKDLS